jgi:hypothetical protein
VILHNGVQVMYILSDNIVAHDHDLLIYASNAYSYVLNTSEHRGIWLNWREFSEVISGYCSSDNPINKAIIETLQRY